MPRQVVLRAGPLHAIALTMSVASLRSVSATEGAGGPFCWGLAATIVGADNADVLVGTEGRDVIVAATRLLAGMAMM